MANRQHTPVMVEFGKRKVVALGLDASPFNREAIRIQAQAGQHPDVFTEAVVVVAGIKRRLGKESGLYVLKHPQVAVYVVSFYLMRRRGCAP